MWVTRNSFHHFGTIVSEFLSFAPTYVRALDRSLEILMADVFFFRSAAITLVVVVDHEAARPPPTVGFGCCRLHRCAIDTKNDITVFEFIHGRSDRIFNNVGG